MKSTGASAPSPACRGGCAAALLAVVGLLVAAPAAALEVPPLRGRVTDLAGLLDGSTRAALERRLAEHERAAGHQMALLIIPSLEGDPLEDFSIRVVEKWKLGSAKHDNGLLLLVVTSERKVRIEVGHGLEGVITDALSAQVIRGVIAPAFKRQDFAGGLSRALDALMQASSGEQVDLPRDRGSSRRRRGGSGLPWWAIMLFFLVAPRGLRWFGLGFLLGGAGRGSWGSRGSSWGGGGFSGGGGSFGGGGASGGW